MTRYRTRLPKTYASFEPALDYCVVKIPKWPFDKFVNAKRTLGTQMKATGEVMAISRSFECALQKALHSLEENKTSLLMSEYTGKAATSCSSFLKYRQHASLCCGGVDL